MTSSHGKQAFLPKAGVLVRAVIIFLSRNFQFSSGKQQEQEVQTRTKSPTSQETFLYAAKSLPKVSGLLASQTAAYLCNEAPNLNSTTEWTPNANLKQSQYNSNTISFRIVKFECNQSPCKI